MIVRTPRIVLLTALFALGLLAAACGGSDPEGEATWETHTASPQESAGSEDAPVAEGGGGEGTAE